MDPNQRPIIQAITNEVLDVLPENWLEVCIHFQMDEFRSEETAVYRTAVKNEVKEFDVPFIPELGRLFRDLNNLVSTGEGKSFTKCDYRLKDNGEFNIDYSYDPIEWPEDEF